MMTDAQAKVQDTTKAAKTEAQTQMHEATKAAKTEAPRISKATGKLMLASIGAIGLMQDWAKHNMDRMVERGEVSRKQARRRMHELRAKGSSLSRSGMDVMTEAAGEAADLPTKADIESLHSQIAELSAKIEQMNKANAKP